MEKFNKRLFIASVGFTMLFMFLGSNGSFNPAKIGFYISILAGVLFYNFTNYGFITLNNSKFKEKSPKHK
jgi:hypothetical protein